MLEKKINIRAADYRFEDKTKYYKGELLDRRQNRKAGTKIVELIKLSNSHTDFVEADIQARNEAIFNGFITYLKLNNLVKD